MALKTLTAANSQYLITIPGLYSSPTPLQGYATDDAFETAASELAEVVKGVDGIMSAGYMPYITEQTVHLQADSPSTQIFEDWLNTSKTAQEVFYANATIILPGLQRKYTLTKGVLRSYVPIPGAKKTMQPRPAIIMWSDISPASF